MFVENRREQVQSETRKFHEKIYKYRQNIISFKNMCSEGVVVGI